MIGLKMFTMDELYELVNAEHSAIQMEEAGFDSGWYDFVSEDYGKKVQSLGKYKEKFEKDLHETAAMVSGNFEELIDLHVEDFETEEDYMEERRMIQEEIMGEISYCLEPYLT